MSGLEFEDKVKGKVAISISSEQARTQRAAVTALDNALQAAPKHLKPNEIAFLEKNKDLVMRCLPMQNGGAVFSSYVFPPMANVTTFFTKVILPYYQVGIDFGQNVDEGAKTKDEKRVGDAMNKYKDDMNSLNRKHGVPEIAEQEVQRRAYAIANQHMSEREATELIGKASRYVGFKNSFRPTVPASLVQTLVRQLREIMKNKDEEERKKLFNEAIRKWKRDNEEHAGFIKDVAEKNGGDIKAIIKELESTIENQNALKRIPRLNSE